MIRFSKYLGITASVFIIFSLTSCVTRNPVQDILLQEDVLEEIKEDSDIFRDLSVILQGDPYLRILVDKNNSLNDYVPRDLVDLKSNVYRSAAGLQLRQAAAASLQEMAAAARSEGLTLSVSSAYRSRLRQADIYAHYVRTMGQRAADRVSARPGYSQHQLGLVVDFNPISNTFARTNEGIWVAANASRFGWSLSYPNGLEEITGYSWESWHYRYVGRELAEFIDKYFDGIQQNALVFINEWEQKRAF